MTDSPRFQLPIDPEERPIEGQLQQIRTKLELLKQDKTNYVRSEDVINLYEEVIGQVHALNTIRQAKNKPDEQNRGISPQPLWSRHTSSVLQLRPIHTSISLSFFLSKYFAIAPELGRRLRNSQGGKDYQAPMTNAI
jgi:hypothetical protein